MNVAADMAVWCHERAATVGVRWVLLLAVAGVLSVTGGQISVTTGVFPALHSVEYCSLSVLLLCRKLTFVEIDDPCR